MILRIVAIIVAGLAGAGFIALAFVWYAQALTSEDAKLRRRVQLAEVVMALAATLVCGATAKSTTDRKMFVIMIVTLLGAGLFRGVRFFLTRRRNLPMIIRSHTTARREE